jgi:mRNA interferase MazF
LHYDDKPTFWSSSSAHSVRVTARRSEIWLIDFGDPIGREQAGRRPAVVTSADALNESQAGVVIVIPTTTARRGLPSHVEIEPESSGLEHVSYAKCEDVTSVSVERLVTRLGLAPPGAMSQIGRILEFLLDL